MGKNKSTNSPKASANNEVRKKSNYRNMIVTGIAMIGIITMGYLFVSKDSTSSTNANTNSVTSNSNNTTNNSNNTTNNSNTANNSNTNSNASNSDNKSKSEVTNATPSTIAGGIEINKSEISSEAKFYPYESDNIKMEVLALKAKDGIVRVAFNTCQVCYTSGKGYYVQEGDVLVCQNCGNRFTADMVGKAKGGCNPVSIQNESIIDDGTNIKIDKKYLDKNKAYFSHWKV